MLKNKFQDKFLQIFPKSIASKIAIAVSGGIDSMALLFLLKELQNNLPAPKLEIYPITIDHKIRKNSTEQSSEIHKYLVKYFPNHQVLTAKYQQDPEANVENIARNERYRLLSQFCYQNNIKYLFLGHHRQDIAENFLIRLFRGSGIDGLAMMEDIVNFKNIKLVRPLLDFSKVELQKYLEKHNLQYFYDETNDENKYLRNKIRFFLNNFEEHELINKRIIAASKNIYESKRIIEEEMLGNASNFLQFNIAGYFTINLERFCKIVEQKFLRYLAWFLIEAGGEEYKPRLEKLQNIASKINKKQAFKATLHGCVIEVEANNLLIYREKSKIANLEINKAGNMFIWDNRYIFKFFKEVNNLLITNILAQDLNKFITDNNISHKLIKNFPKKEILQTIPVIRHHQKIIYIPFLNWVDKNYENKVTSTLHFNFHTPLRKIYEDSAL